MAHLYFGGRKSENKGQLFMQLLRLAVLRQETKKVFQHPADACYSIATSENETRKGRGLIE